MSIVAYVISEAGAVVAVCVSLMGAGFSSLNIIEGCKLITKVAEGYDSISDVNAAKVSAKDCARGIALLGVEIIPVLFGLIKRGFAKYNGKEIKVGEKYTGGRTQNVRIESFTPPGSSKPIEIYTDGFSRVPKGKIDIYARGHVKKPLNYDIREKIRTQFKKLPKEKITKQMNDENAAWEREIHNYERALGNGSALEKAGIPDTPENNEMIAKVLCEAGNKVSENNTIIQTELCINENKVILNSRWKIDRDKRPYMTTIIVKGVK